MPVAVSQSISRSCTKSASGVTRSIGTPSCSAVIRRISKRTSSLASSRPAGLAGYGPRFAIRRVRSPTVSIPPGRCRDRRENMAKLAHAIITQHHATNHQASHVPSHAHAAAPHTSTATTNPPVTHMAARSSRADISRRGIRGLTERSPFHRVRNGAPNSAFNGAVGRTSQRAAPPCSTASFRNSLNARAVGHTPLARGSLERTSVVISATFRTVWTSASSRRTPNRCSTSITSSTLSSPMPESY